MKNKATTTAIKADKGDTTIGFCRNSKPTNETVCAEIRKETGHTGGIRLRGYRMIPQMYESPFWEFLYRLES